MPHLFANRPRQYALTGLPGDRANEFLWESLNAFLYKLGGGVFVAGSLLFFPAFAASRISAPGPSSPARCSIWW